MPWRAAYAKGVLGAMLVFLVNGLVYDILYYHWFQDQPAHHELCLEPGERSGATDL